MLTRNIAKSGEVLNLGGFSPFQLHLGLIRYHSQFASCHIAIRCSQLYRLSTQRLNIDMKPKELLIEAVNKFYERKAQKEGIYVLRFTIEIYEKAKGRSYWCNWL